MKRNLLLFLVTLLPMVASAYDAEVDGIYYNFAGDEAMVTYKNTSYNSYSGAVVIPASITYNDKTYSVTSIGDYSFLSCSSLTSVTIPESVTTIGNGAFQGCGSLISVTIPNRLNRIGIYAFLDCPELTSISIPDSVNHIGSGAFKNCNGLVSITIPEGVSSINGQTFFGCSSLTSITIPESVTSIGIEAFRGCNSLSSITIPNNVTSIGYCTFYGCSSLTSVIISNSLTSIEQSVFYGCSNLTSVTIPDSVASIGNYAFEGCSSLAFVVIGGNIASIGDRAFKDCKLRNVLIKCITPPTANNNSFSDQTYYHTSLYIPKGSWDAYAYDDNWYKFINIRETAMTEEELSTRQTYTLMDANTFAYSVYDPVNDCIGTISSVGINEDNPNHSWQILKDGSQRYLYNIGARKYAKKGAKGLELSDQPEAIEIGNGENGIVLGGQTSQKWAFVSNEHLNTDHAIVDGIVNAQCSMFNVQSVYDLNGRRVQQPRNGIYIKNGRKILMQ